EPPHRVSREMSGTVAGPRLDHIETVVPHARLLLARRLGGTDVEPTIDLPGIGREDLERPVSGQCKGDGGLAHGGRPDQHRDFTAGQTFAPAPRVAAARSWPGRGR